MNATSKAGEDESSAERAAGEPSARLFREWAVCGLVASVARFVPVPLLDDVVKERATRIGVARTLDAHGRRYRAKDVEILYTGTEGWFAGVRKYVAEVPTKVVLFPVRKYVAVLGAVKGVPTDVLEVVLLCRTVNRALAAGLLPDEDKKARRRDARAVRHAYETALEGTDLSLLTAALAQGLSKGRELATATVDLARDLLNRGDDDDVDVPTDGELSAGAEDVEEAFARSDVREVLSRFDARVDAALARGV